MFSFPEAARHFGLKPLAPSPGETLCRGASIDTRSIRPGDCFFALSGQSVDGHQFLEKAFSLGASAAVVSQHYVQSFEEGKALPHGFKNVLCVEDPAAFLADLASWHRSKFAIPFVGITGSVGKTSTKEFLRYLLQTQSPPESVLATKGNLNNHLGLPLTLLELHEGHRFCVAEMGANAPGDIAFLCRILKPDAGIVTCVAPVHLEGMGSLQGIYKTKTDLFRALKPGAIAVTSAGDPEMDGILENIPVRVLKAGLQQDCEGSFSDVQVTGDWVSFLYRGQKRFSFPGLAGFLALNASLALLLAESLGVLPGKLPDRWEGFQLPDGRFTIKTLSGGIRVIYDGYNASPKSFEKALETLTMIPCEGKRIVVFSDMRELGDASADFHRALGLSIDRSGLDAAYAFGQESRAAIEAMSQISDARHFDGPDDLSAYLGGRLEKGDMLLLKASRGMKIERVLERLEKNPG